MNTTNTLIALLYLASLASGVKGFLPLRVNFDNPNGPESKALMKRASVWMFFCVALAICGDMVAASAAG